MGSLAYRAYQFIWSGLDWVYPPICVGCGVQGVRWCASCAHRVSVVRPPYCSICGQAAPFSGQVSRPSGQAQLGTVVCDDCQTSPPHFSALRSYAVFEGALRKAIHQLKYHRDIALGEVLARPLTNLLRSLGWAIDLVIPVPLSLARLAERGYNQASLLAAPLALSLGLDYRTKALSRVQETRSQIGLSAPERKTNVQNAFQARSGLVAGKVCLVVDDVTTTGATMEACAAALIEAEAAGVYGLTLARAGMGAYQILKTGE